MASSAGSRVFPLWRTVLLAVALVSAAVVLVAAIGLSVHLSSLSGPLLPKTAGHGGVLPVGRSSPLYALYAFVAPIVIALTFVGTGAVIAWRRATERGPLVFSLLLIAFGDAFALGAFAPEPAHSSALVRFFVVAGFASLAVACYLFPDGRLIPRWTVWPAVVWLYVAVATTWLAGSSADPSGWTGIWAPVFWLPLIGTCLVAPIYRYRSVSGPIERQQTKWVALGFSAMVVALNLYTSDIAVPTGLVAWRQLLLGLLLMACLLLIPLTIGIAMLRYRLWDVDVLINRTLVYGSLTISLGVLYVLSVVALQVALRAITGQGSGLAVAISTLAIAALFQPLRRRIQALIDRRFYRRKYDAARTLAAFGATLRDDVDLDQLTGDLLTVVQETMQPSHVSLWLR